MWRSHSGHFQLHRQFILARYIRSEIVSSSWQVRWIREVANFLMRLFWHLFLMGRGCNSLETALSFQSVSPLFVNLVFIYFYIDTVQSWKAELEGAVNLYVKECDPVSVHFQLHKECWFH